MAVTRMVPYGPRRPAPAGFGGLQTEINRLFDDLWRGFDMPGFQTGREMAAFTPQVDVSESERAWHLELELPGLVDRDVEVDVQENVLTVRGEKTATSDRKERNLHVSERTFGRFQRSMRLPPGADLEGIEARFENGVLHVTVPKTEQAQQRTRRIEVKAG